MLVARLQTLRRENTLASYTDALRLWCPGALSDAVNNSSSDTTTRAAAWCMLNLALAVLSLTRILPSIVHFLLQKLELRAAEPRSRNSLPSLVRYPDLSSKKFRNGLKTHLFDFLFYNATSTSVTSITTSTTTITTVPHHVYSIVSSDWIIVRTSRKWGYNATTIHQHLVATRARYSSFTLSMA